jgi:hypothetical protein
MILFFGILQMYFFMCFFSYKNCNSFFTQFVCAYFIVYLAAVDLLFIFLCVYFGVNFFLGRLKKMYVGIALLQFPVNVYTFNYDLTCFTNLKFLNTQHDEYI